MSISPENITRTIQGGRDTKGRGRNRQQAHPVEPNRDILLLSSFLGEGGKIQRAGYRSPGGL